jgi:hypothetical protein
MGTANEGRRGPDGAVAVPTVGLLDLRIFSPARRIRQQLP